MSDVTNEAAYVKAPIAGKVIRLDVSTAAARFAIPPAFQGAQCTWSLYSDDLATAIVCSVAFGTSTVALTEATNSSVTSEEITVSALTGARVYSAGGSRHWVMPIIEAGVTTHFAIDASGDGVLEIVKG